MADQALAALSPEFDRMYAEAGRPSIPPERLLKASVLIALYSVRSERAFCEELDYHLLFRWFLDMNLIERCLRQGNAVAKGLGDCLLDRSEGAIGSLRARCNGATGSATPAGEPAC